MGSKYQKNKILNFGHQILAMKSCYPSFQITQKNGIITWTGIIKPTPLSVEYKVEIQYSQTGIPKVWVLSPDLSEISGKKIPHTYSEKRLCLYLPGIGEWSKSKLIAKTIVPWTSLWLYYYELWHVTGEWLGGGVHPHLEKKDKFSEVS
jgi:hypothetical protein